MKFVSALVTLSSLAAGHDVIGYSQTASVPGPPEWATLQVLGSNTLQTTFAPPLWDGGSPITSYLVEWDKEAGIPEVQRITVSQNLNANEIQTITTSVPDVNEVQVIRTSATPRAEVQAITISPPTGDITVDSAYSFALSLDTIETGGSLQFSGQISANADADGSRLSVAEILENMANVHGRPTVERARMNADGGHTYLVTFPMSMGNVPEMKVLMTDLPVSISTVEEGNELDGSFRLEFMGDLTADIPFDATSAEMQSHLERLDSIGAVSVTRSAADEQGGFSWDIEFLSGDNSGNVDPIVVHGDGLFTTNPVGGALIENAGGVDGSYISGSFTLSFRGPSTNPIPFDADSSVVKQELEALPTIAQVAVERTPLDILGGCTWTIYFMEDETRLHRGDMPMLQVTSSLVGSQGQTPSIVVAEERKGTKKEVQTISIEAGGDSVDPTSSFKLRFGDEVTGDILALPIDWRTCLGSTKAKQIITTSTVDTSGVGGDDSVSHLTSFALTYEGYTTSNIMANVGSCEETSEIIASELMKLPPLYEIDVTGADTSAGDEGCSWTVTFLITAFNGDEFTSSGYSVTLGDEYSIIRDTISITQPNDFRGDANLIQSELSKLDSIGVVTVSPQSPAPDSSGQCVWEVTFESKAGNVPSIEVAKSGTVAFSTAASLNSGDRVVVTDDTVRGTSIPVSGDFRLEFDGLVTGYLPYNASPLEMKAALDALENIGHVAVSRTGPDVNRCYTWDITFVSDLGPLPLIVPDDLDLRGTVASMSVSKATVGLLPPFRVNGPDYGSHVITDTTDLSFVIPGLKQGIPYYVRISASSQMGTGPSIMPYPPMETPHPQPPTDPLSVDLESKDGSTLAVSISSPFHDGDEDVSTYRVDYSTSPFAQEKQRVSITCNPQPEIQSITTVAADINEVQYLVFDSSFQGTELTEVQRVLCDATGGTFGLSLRGETAYISHDDDANGIKEALESLSLVEEVVVNINAGSTACLQHDGAHAGDFSVTFQSLIGVAGDLPLMTTETSGLSGARQVEVQTVTDGDAALGGSFVLAFRGATTQPIDVSADLADLAAAVDSSLEALDTIQQDGVSVTAVNLGNGGYEKILRIELQGDGVGGNVEPIVVVPEFLLIVGSSADAFVLSDGESYAARNGLDLVVSTVGNELSGHFRLKLRGHTTDRITFNSSVDQLKARLEELPNVGEVKVQMSGPSKELAYNWEVTFLSNPGYFPPSTRDVDLLEAISELSTSVDTDASADIIVQTVRDGDDKLKGQFTLAFNDGRTVETTRPLESFISAEDLKMELEALSNVGRVDVVRTQSLIGYEWDIEFTSCALKNGVEVCNDGNLLNLEVLSINLQGCGGPVLAVEELIAGNGADECSHLPAGICFDELPFNGTYPIEHNIRDLVLGTPYYVQARLRNSESYGYRRLSIPANATPRHNPPGPPPPVVLIESSSSSITVGWSTPKNNGGKTVSGYELWMDSWNGGETFMVYDGAGSPNTFHYRLTTDDVGPHSQLVETGRQYRFQVRAINNCYTTDPTRACYGEFSQVQIFTVREPRPPLPPSLPKRDAQTRVMSPSEASISISWTPSIDNGGSIITGYIVYVRDSDGTMASHHAVGADTLSWQENGLRPGEIYRFHVVAVNAIGKSGNSPVLSTLAAVAPGLNFIGEPRYSDLNYRPSIVEVHETSLSTKWSHVPEDISGGSPITGFKLYLYKDIQPLARYDADPILQEVQHIIISSESTVTGTFTVSFRGYETSDIPADASDEDVKVALENLPSIGFVDVEPIANGWAVKFLSEAGDLPMMEATSGRLLGDVNAKVLVKEATQGDHATLIYDGSEAPAVLTFEALSLTADLNYAFKVAPVNSVGDGVLSAASIVTSARSGASASKTTASGGALSRGIAGSIHEQQIVTFLSHDCAADRLVLSLELLGSTRNLCGATEDEFESALESLSGVGDVHVVREEYSVAGHVGFSWAVTFNSRTGDVPLLSVDRSQVGAAMDSLGESGSNAVYVTEFLKGQANEFTIEPKKASGTVVKDMTTHAGMEGGDVFFTELWTSDPSITDGSHTWYSDGGVGSYNRLLYEEQLIGIPNDVESFSLAMDTSETQPFGRINGQYIQTETFRLEEVTDLSLQSALSNLPNVGKVDVTRASMDHNSIAYYVVTFKELYGEMPLLSASDPSIIISRNGGQHSATEVQSITISADKPFVYEVQSILIANSCSTFDVSFMGSSKTTSIPCNFTDASDFAASSSLLQTELNAFPNVNVRVDPTSSALVGDANPWQFRVTFLEPVGSLPLLESEDVQISQVVQGESTLSGSFVLSYEGEYTDDISFDASARDVKAKLEALDAITQVNVKRIDKYTGYQWAVSFTGNAGNLPLMIVHDKVFEVQSIETVGGQPTPLGGTFTLSYLSETTSPLPHDCSADILKYSLESLPAIDRVDVSQQMFEHGQSRWLVTFRSPSNPALLQMNSTGVSGTLGSAAVAVEVDFQHPSLLVQSGSAPTMIVEKKIAGRPSYTGQYIAETAGTYTLAVMQLESGGLNAKYYDNQWLLEEPVVERVDPTINFDWGSGLITQFGRDFISARWWGKVLPSTSELYTFYLVADDGARVYVDHNLIIDSWEESAIEKRANIELTTGKYHDIKVEYKHITGDASIQLEWSTRSIKKQVIPPSRLFYTSHIVGSPFLTTISPGAADYPYSTFIDDAVEGDRTVAIAGERTSFYLQAKDSSGNNKLTNGEAQGDVQSPEEQFTVDIIGSHGSVSGDVTYMSSGQYRVDYTVLKTGTYQVHVKTGGTDIYCGKGKEHKCSPFTLTVLPGATVASNCEAESSFDPVDNLVEARAGDTGKIYLQAKDSFGNNRRLGGDDVSAKFKDSTNSDIQYRGNVVDRGDGSYVISYSIPLAGDYIVSITINGEAVQYCVGPNGQRWDSRFYDGVRVYSSPSFCSLNDNLTLNVIHRSIHGLSSTLVEERGLLGLTDAIAGIETGFVIESRDKFGNLRVGSSTSNLAESGDGMSDVFLVKLVSPSGHSTLTSSAVQILTSSDSNVPGYFRLSYGGLVSPDVPYDISGPALQTVLSSMHTNQVDASSVKVQRVSDSNGNYEWKVTFVHYLELWSENPLQVLPGSDGFSAVSDLMTVDKVASSGRYPITYKVWEKGSYDLSVYFGDTLVSGSSYTVEVINGSPQASSSFAYGSGLENGMAGEQSSFEVQVMDGHRSEIQSIVTSSTVIDFVSEIQRIKVVSSYGNSFQLVFRGQQTSNIEVGVAALQDMEDALEALLSIGDVSVTSNGMSVIESGDTIDVEFITEHGSLELLRSTGSEIISKLQVGEAPYRSERQSISCNADGGYVILSFQDRTVTVDFDDSVAGVRFKLHSLVGSSVTILQESDLIDTFCDPIGNRFFLDFPIELGDVPAIGVNLDALQNGSLVVYGNGESEHGAVNGISPIMGHFTLSHEGVSTAPITVDASAGEVKVALESLPSIGSVSVTKDLIGIRRDINGENLVPGATSLLSIWSVTFADEREDGCQPGSWDKCPSNIGDVPALAVDGSMVTFDIGARQQQMAPVVSAVEVTKGSTGNFIVDEDQVTIDFALTHDVDIVGIGMAAVHEITCTYSPDAIAANDPTGSFDIYVFDKRITVAAQTSMSQLKNLLRAELNLEDAISTSGSSYGTVCRFDSNNPVHAVTKLTFSSSEKAFPEFIVRSTSNVVVSSRNVVSTVDKIQYRGSGLFRVDYTPKFSGMYSAAIKINDEYIWTDLSSGVIVSPTFASAQRTTHNSNTIAVAGFVDSFNIVLRDRFGNWADASFSNETSVMASLTGAPHHCNRLNATDEPAVVIQGIELGSDEGHYKISYTPVLAGQYQASVMMRSQGGLLATYFKNQDFSHPVYGNFHYSTTAEQGAAWCINGACDSTLLDKEVSFSWGFDSPLPSDPTFPVDSFSVRWIGDLKVDASDEYIFTVKLNGGVRLTVGGGVVIDSIGGVNAESISSETVILLKDVFYPITIEYSHFTDEANVELLWKTSATPPRTVPSSAFYFTRHVEDSPFSVQVLPSEVAPRSTARGEGLDACIALEECSFVIHTNDENGNSRFNDGSDPSFEITLIGNGGWAQEGRINSVVESLNPAEVSIISSESNDWEYIGQVDATHKSFSISTNVNMLGLLSRGDNIVIDGVMYTISSTGNFDSGNIPLHTSFLGETDSNIPLYKASKSCMSGTHTIKYTPEIRGSYELDVKLSKVVEVQRVTTFVLNGASLSGTFSLNYGVGVSDAIKFDASAAEIKSAVESIQGFEDVDVSIHGCANASISCSWDITFVSYIGDVIAPLVDKDQLIGVGADVHVEELVKGKHATSITGFPRTVDVSPGDTSSLMTTAYGSGLVTATVGQESTFTIQAKDFFGNDRLDSQDANLFAVHVYPEEDYGSYHITKGHVTKIQGGAYQVNYTPFKSGFHTVAVALSVATEKQIITTGYNTKSRGGSFKFILNKKPSRSIPWDAGGDEIAAYLDDSFGATSLFEVEKQSHGLFNYKYIVSFKTLIGDAPLLVVDTSNLIGNTQDWDIAASDDGQFSHIKVLTPHYEVQQVDLTVDDPANLNGATFSLSFMGRRTEPISWNDDSNDLKTKLQKLATIGDLSVSSRVDGATNARTWLVTFDPHKGRSSKGLYNYGNVPSLQVSDIHGSIDVTVQTVQNGQSPFRALVLPGEPSNQATLAYDYSNVENFEGLSTGTYNIQSYFYLQTRDEHLNEVMDGPMSEVQIIETSASNHLSGRFEISILDHTLRFDASAFTSEVERAIQTVPGVGSVVVSSNSAKDEVIGKTAAVTRGLSIFTPSAQLDEFVVGDWIRIGDEDGQLFSIIAMSEVHPFSVTLSTPYLEESNDFATIYQHGTLFNRKGYQYIVSFDSTLGDVPPIQVDGTLLEGNDAAVEVTHCDWNISQDLRLYATGPNIVSGYFYLKYGDEQTRLLSVDVTAEELTDAIASDISSIDALGVEYEQDYAFGGKLWTIRLQSFDEEAKLFFAEGYLINGGSIICANHCSTASRDNPLYSVQSVAGRRGKDFAVTLDGPLNVRGRVDHEEDGRYLASYLTPRSGEYTLSVLGVNSGGLTGEYFSIQSIQNSPVTTRVNDKIDLHWNSTNPIFPNSSDTVHIRWTGYVKPSFEEVHTFIIRLIGGVRLWIGNELVIDENEAESEPRQLSGSTAGALVANQLDVITIEYVASSNNAMIQLFWESVSQPLAIIDSHRLFHGAGHVSGSPFMVSPQSVEAASPIECTLNNVAWNALSISWSTPNDDGGDAITKYLVESWDANVYSQTEKQQLRLKQTITGGSYLITMNEHTTRSLQVDASALDFEQMLESLPNVGDVSVSKSIESGFTVYDIEFLTDNAPLSVLDVNLDSATPDIERVEYCICAKGNTSCHHGSPLLSCEAASSREGSVFTSSTELSVGVSSELIFDNGGRFSYTIGGLEQSSSISEGFGVRVSAGNSQGYGVPCKANFMKPFAPPLPPAVIEMERKASNPSSLVLHFTSVTYPENMASVVTGYYVEWSTTEDFLPGTVWNATVNVEDVKSERLPSYNNVNREFNFYVIQDLKAGVPYFVRMAAINEAGAGLSAYSTPLSLTPGSKPSNLDHGVTLRTLDAVRSTVTVRESCSSLHLSWRAPALTNGFDVSTYLVEYWVANGVAEVQQLILTSPTMSPTQGTFTLEYGDERTDSLSIDISADDLRVALENLSTIRSVKVWRSGSNPNYEWTITFLSEFPSVYGSVLRVVEGFTQLVDTNGDNPTMHASVLVVGSLPVGYSTQVVTVDDPHKTHYTLTLENLTPGQPYQVQVSASNSLGYGHPQPSVPRQLAPPVEKPSAPTNVILRVVSSNALEVFFSKPDSNGGDEITLYKIEWDILPDFHSDEGAPLGSYSYVPPRDEVGCDPCTHQITGLTKGVNYFVRVYAYNSRGYSLEHGSPSPPFLSPKTTPDPPAIVNITQQSDTAILVAFPPSIDNGGAPVTKYKIEWNAMGHIPGVTRNNDLLYSKYNVQSITLTANEDNIGGTFRIAFENHATDSISVESSAYEMKLAIESLPTIGSAMVTRETLTNGVRWSITFLTNFGYENEFGPIHLMSVSIDSADLPEDFVEDTLELSSSVTTTLLGAGARLAVSEEATAFRGFEQQVLTAQCSSTNGILAGHFTISVDGSRTMNIPPNASALDLKRELEALDAVGTIKVLRQRISDRINSFKWTVIFIERLGPVPLLEVQDFLTCSDNSARPLIFNSEIIQGTLPRMGGPHSGFIEIDAQKYCEDNSICYLVDGLVSGMPYHFEVSAWNGAGDVYGISQYSTPPLLIPMGDADPPTSVDMVAIDNSTLEVRWNAPLSKHRITSYQVSVHQYPDDDYVGTYDVEYTAEVQTIIFETSADDMGGDFIVSFNGASSEAISVDSSPLQVKEKLEGIPTIEEVNVEVSPHTIGTALSYGKKWVITFLTQEGNLPLMLVSTGVSPSTIAAGGSLTGSSPIVRVETVSDGVLPTSFVTPSILDKAKLYVAKVRAFNGHTWSNTTTSEYAMTPSKTIPSPPINVKVDVLSDTVLGVSWEEPQYSGGEAIAGYLIQFDDDENFDGASVEASASMNHIVLENLDPTQSYFVRVLAFSAFGYSSPVSAQPLLANRQELEISLRSTDPVTFDETWLLRYKGRESGNLSVIETAASVEQAMTDLGIRGAISVDREDTSSSFDNSGIDTEPLRIVYRVRIFGDYKDNDGIQSEIEIEAAAPGITASIVLIN